MSFFRYRGFDGSQNEVAGTVSADSRMTAISQLQKEGVRVFSVIPVEKILSKDCKRSSLFAVSSKQVSGQFDILPWLRRLKISIFERSGKKFTFYAQMVFFHQLAILTKAGIPIVHGLRSASVEFRVGELNIGNELAKQVINGHSLSAAISAYPDIFQPHVIALIRAGEEAGTLSEMLGRIADLYESKFRLLRSIKSSLFYPTIILVFSIVVLIGLCQFVLPVFVNVFETQKIALPPVTQTFLKLISFTSSRWFLVFSILNIVIIVGWLKMYLRVPQHRKFLEQFLWFLPVIKHILANIGSVQLCKSFSELNAGGISVIKSLKLSSGTISSLILQEEIEGIINKVITGENLSEAFLDTRHFPVLIGTMLRVAEKTGMFSDILQKSSKYFHLEVETTLQSLQSLIEPLVLGLLGVLVAIFILIFFLPVYSALNPGG